MSYRTSRFIFILLVLSSCVALLMLVSGCRAVTPAPTATPTPTSAPTLSPTLTFTPPPCCADLEFPPVCGLLPGQSTTTEVRQILGSPAFIEDLHEDIGATGPPDTRWYLHGCGVALFFEGETLAFVSYNIGDVTLGEAVEQYGPPQKVLLILFARTQEGPVDYYWAAFSWPAAGVVAYPGRLFPEALDPENLQPFSSSLDLGRVNYSHPDDLEEVLNYFYGDLGDPHLLLDWPGMAE